MTMSRRLQVEVAAGEIYEAARDLIGRDKMAATEVEGVFILVACGKAAKKVRKAFEEAGCLTEDYDEH